MKSMTRYINYLIRVIPAYLFRGSSQLAFWHEEPKTSPDFRQDQIGAYYMDFLKKAHYAVHLDPEGIPLLDYKGHIGKQYNPIAIAQFGLGNYNLFTRTQQEQYREAFLKAADWMIAHLCQNQKGVWVWMHYFDWEYQELLRNPWYSGLAQGQGISLLVRAFLLTQEERYREAATQAYAAFEKNIDQGGVMYRDDQGCLWIEEYIVSQPTHILNGFIWALWGVYDYYLSTNNPAARSLWEEGLKTIEKNLERYDTGYWSLYDLSKTGMKNTASFFYHRLHIVQMEILYHLSGKEIFKNYRDRWKRDKNHAVGRSRALWDKIIFKLRYF